jgi:hypothetical protein
MMTRQRATRSVKLIIRGIQTQKSRPAEPGGFLYPTTSKEEQLT